MKKYALTLVAALSLGVMAQSAMAGQLNDVRAVTATDAAKTAPTVHVSLVIFTGADMVRHHGFRLDGGAGGAGEFAAVTDNGLVLTSGQLVTGNPVDDSATVVLNGKPMPTDAVISRRGDAFFMILDGVNYTVPANAPSGTAFTVVS